MYKFIRDWVIQSIIGAIWKWLVAAGVITAIDIYAMTTWPIIVWVPITCFLVLLSIILLRVYGNKKVLSQGAPVSIKPARPSPKSQRSPELDEVAHLAYLIDPRAGNADTDIWPMLDHLKHETAYGAVVHWSHVFSDLTWAVREDRIRVWARPRRSDPKYGMFPASEIVSFEAEEFDAPVRIRTTGDAFWYDPRFNREELEKEFKPRRLNWQYSIEYLLDHTAIGNSTRDVSYAEYKLSEAAVSGDESKRITFWGQIDESSPHVPISLDVWKVNKFDSDGFHATIGQFKNIEIPGPDLMRVWRMTH